MIRFHFEDGFADVEFSSIPEGIYQNGFPCEAFWHGKKYSAYIVLNRKDWHEPSYIDLDLTVDGEDINVFHGSLTGVEALSYDESFAEIFDHNYDERGWLDDMWCARDNECANISHWDTVAKEVAVGEDSEVCGRIYLQELGGTTDSKEHLDDGFIEEFGEYIACKYRREIQERIDHYGKAHMELCVEAFKKELFLND